MFTWWESWEMTNTFFFCYYIISRQLLLSNVNALPLCNLLCWGKPRPVERPLWNKRPLEVTSRIKVFFFFFLDCTHLVSRDPHTICNRNGSGRLPSGSHWRRGLRWSVGVAGLVGECTRAPETGDCWTTPSLGCSQPSGTCDWNKHIAHILSRS